MAYAPNNRDFYDADSHVMELPNFIIDYEDKELAGKLGFGGLGSQMPVYTGLVAFTFFAVP